MDSVRMLNIEFVDETGAVEAESLGHGHSDRKRMAWKLGDDDTDSDGTVEKPRPGKKTRGRVKIRMAYINDKIRRYTTFSKRKTGIMKKAYELAALTGTQVMLLVASETGHVYTFATRKLQPVIMSDNGKALIQTCLNSPDSPSSPPPAKDVKTRDSGDQRMNPLGFEERDLVCFAGEGKSAEVAAQAQVKQSHSDQPDRRQTFDSIASVAGMLLSHGAAHDRPAPAPRLSIIPQHQQSKSEPRQQHVVAAGAYLSALEDLGLGQVAQSTLESCTSAANSNPEAAPPAQMYYRIAGTNQFLSLPVGGADASGAAVYRVPLQTGVPPVSATARNLVGENCSFSLTGSQNMTTLSTSPDFKGTLAEINSIE